MAIPGVDMVAGVAVDRQRGICRRVDPDLPAFYILPENHLARDHHPEHEVSIYLFGRAQKAGISFRRKDGILRLNIDDIYDQHPDGR